MRILLLLGFSALLLTACTSSRNGTSSGGGGFVDENSRQLIQMVNRDLSQKIASSTPAIWGDLPNGWSQNSLSAMVSSIRLSPGESKIRHGKELMFDYGQDSSGQFIKALEPFFSVYASYPVKFAKKEDLRLIIKDIELKILHEIAHHVLSHADKYSNGTAIKEIEAESDAFGMNILKVLDSDILVCQNENLVPRQISFSLCS